LIIQFYFVISTYLGGDTNSVTDEIQEILNTLGQVLTESVSVERAMNHAILIVQVDNHRGSKKVLVNIQRPHFQVCFWIGFVWKVN
jgi:hypothetical protein